MPPPQSDKLGIVNIKSDLKGLAMPTIIYVKGYRLYFVSFDGTERMHVHVRKGNQNAKVWIGSLTFAWSQFREHDSVEILRIVKGNEHLIREKWHEYFGECEPQ